MSQDNKNGNSQRPQKPMFDQDSQGARPSADQNDYSDIPVRKNPQQGQKPDAAQRSGEAKYYRKDQGAAAEKQAAKKRRRKKRGVTAAIVALVLILAIVGGMFGLLQWVSSQALDSSENFQTSAAEALGTDAIPEYDGAGIVAGLVCGIDYNNEEADGFVEGQEAIGNTDMIMYVMFDTVSGEVNVMQIPRDMYVGEEVEAGQYQKINGVYPAAEDPEGRMTALATVINDQLGLPVDFYIKLDLDALKALVGHMGHISVYVPHEITDAETGNLLINDGWVNITDQEVEYLVRNRNYPTGDIARLQTQLSLYSALFREFSRLEPLDLVMWMRILLYYVDIGGLDVLEIGGLAQEALGIQASDITFIRPPYGGGNNPDDGQDYVYLLPEETADLLNEYFRPDGHTMGVDELNIHTLPSAEYGTAPAEIMTMETIQQQEPSE